MLFRSLEDVDDSARGRDPRIRFTAPADGSYRVMVRDLNGQGGVRYVYLLTAGPPRPDFGLTLKADQFSVKPGQTLDLAVSVDRRESFDGAIEVFAEDLPDGVTASPVKSEPKGSSARSVTLKVSAKAGALSGPIRIVGKHEGGRQRLATAPVPGHTGSIDSIWLTVLKPAPPESGKPKTK